MWGHRREMLGPEGVQNENISGLWRYVFAGRLKKQHVFRVTGVQFSSTTSAWSDWLKTYRPSTHRPCTHTLQVEKLRFHHMLMNPNYLNARGGKERDAMDSVIHHGVKSIICGYSEVKHCEPEQAAIKQQESPSLLLRSLMLHGSQG